MQRTYNFIREFLIKHFRSKNRRTFGSFWVKLTKEEEILLFEKRYLKKFLRFHNLYITGMTLEEMRVAKRFHEASMELDDIDGEDRFGSLCKKYHCSCYSEHSKSVPKSDIKEGSYFSQKSPEQSYPSGSPGNTKVLEKEVNSLVTCTAAKETTVCSPPKKNVELPIRADNTTLWDLPPLDLEIDLGPFILDNCNGPTYISFEQPEP